MPDHIRFAPIGILHIGKSGSGKVIDINRYYESLGIAQAVRQDSHAL